MGSDTIDRTGPASTSIQRRSMVSDPIDHAPSPNLSAISAASIITPMMLFALTLRPLRDMLTSHGYLAASWVSLADARACSPRLLRISTSRRCMDRARFDMQHTVASSADGLGHHHRQTAVA